MSKKHPHAEELPSAFSLFKPSYEAIMVNIWTFLALLLLPIAGFIVSSFLNNGSAVQVDATRTSVSSTALIFTLVSAVIGLLVAPAIPFVQLKSIHGQEVTLGEAFQAGKKYFWRFYGLSILTGLVVLGGFLLLIIPGFFMIRRYMLAPFYLYDRDLKIRESMRHSASDSKIFSGAIWGLLGVSFLIGLVGVVPLLAVVAAILQVVYYCAPAVRYQQIKEASKHVPKE